MEIVKIVVCVLSVLNTSIGVISPYSAQVDCLRRELDALEKRIGKVDLEVSTIDGYQGREKDIIILSMVRSNENMSTGFIEETKRMNVAITRARKLVILIGDSSTICKADFVFDLVSYIQSKGKKLEIVIKQDETKNHIRIFESK